MKTNEQYPHIDMTFYNKNIACRSLLWLHYVCVFVIVDSLFIGFHPFSIFIINSVCVFRFYEWILSIFRSYEFILSVFYFYDCILSIFSIYIPYLWLDSDSFFSMMNPFLMIRFHVDYILLLLFFDWIFFFFFEFSTFSTSIPFVLLDSSRIFKRQFHFMNGIHLFFPHVDSIFKIEFRLWFPCWFHFYECILSMFSIFMNLSFLSFPYLFNFHGWILTVVVFSMAIPFNLLYFYFFNWIVHFYCCIPSVEYEWNPPVFFPCLFHFYHLIPPEISMLIPFILLHSFLFFHFHEFIPSIFMNAFCLCFPLLLINSVRVFYFRVFHLYDCIPSVFSMSNLFLWLDSTCIFHVDFIFFSLDWFLDSACLLPPPPTRRLSIYDWILWVFFNVDSILWLVSTRVF